MTDKVCWKCRSKFRLRKAYDGVNLCLKCRIKDFFYRLLYC